MGFLSKLKGRLDRTNSVAVASEAQSSVVDEELSGTAGPSKSFHDSKNPEIQSDPPPSYSTHEPAPASSSSKPDTSSTEDPYAYLALFDTIFVIDDSGSMRWQRWKEVRDILAAITPVCVSHDADGVDVYFLNHEPTDDSGFENNGTGYVNVASAKTVHKLFKQVEPLGPTPTGSCLQGILAPYIAQLKKHGCKNVKPINIIVFTDGAATDNPKRVIKNTAEKLDRLKAPRHQVGIQFFQVGDDPKASADLEVLDDDLSKEGVRDMVDTTRGLPLTLGGILKVVLGGVQRRFDKLSTDDMNQLYSQ